MPGSTYLYLVWETLALISSKPDISEFNVEFSNIRYHRTTTLNTDVSVKLSILIHTNGNFELTEGQTAMVSGTIKQLPNELSLTKLLIKPIDENSLILSKKEIYQEFKLRGYKHTKEFKAMNSFCCDDNAGRLQWSGHWDVFMDAMTHAYVISRNTRKLHFPTSVRRIKINAIEHLNYLKSLEGRKRKLFDVVYNKNSDTIISGGIEITGIETKAFERRKPDETEALESYEFVPLIDKAVRHNLNDAVRICLHLIVEKLLPKQLNILEVLDNDSAPVIECFRDIVLVTPRINATYKLITNKKIDMESIQVESPEAKDQTKYTISIWNSNAKDVTSILGNVSPQGYLIVVENNEETSNIQIPNGYSMVSFVQSANVSFSILQLTVNNETKYKIVSIDSADHEYTWLMEVQAAKFGDNIILLSQRDKLCGILGFLNTLRCEPIEANYQCIIIEDAKAPEFDVNNPFYKSQLSLNLPVNIYRNAKWGTFRYLELRPRKMKINKSIPLFVQISHVGHLQSLEWVPTSHCDSVAEMIQICYTGLNKRDLMLAKGEWLQDAYVDKKIQRTGVFGREYSGIDSNGNRVMGLSIDGGALSTNILPSSNNLLFKVPDSMSFGGAATIPLAYSSVYSGFFIRNQIVRENSILIHGGNYWIIFIWI